MSVEANEDLAAAVMTTRAPNLVKESSPARAFDPRTEVSADAKYVVKQLVLWFLVLPALLALLIWGVTR